MTAAAEARDREFTAFVVSYRGSLLRVAFLLSGDWGKAEDVIQVSLVKLYLAWERVHGSPQAYVRTIIARTAVDEHRRARNREVSARDLPDAGQPDSDASAGLDLRAALMRLPSRQRQVVVLRYYEELSVRETAATLGISAGTVKSSCARGLMTLNQLLTDRERLMRP